MATARDLGDAVVGLIPRRSARSVLRQLVEPLANDRPSGQCPRCGRALPVGSLGRTYTTPGITGPVGIPYTTEERIAACLVDGVRRQHARDLPLDELLDAASAIADGLAAAGWKHAAHRIHDSLQRDSSTGRAEATGQALEVLRTSGPPGFVGGAELETLIASLAQFWPTDGIAS